MGWMEHRLGISDLLRRIGATKASGDIPLLADVVVPTVSIGDLAQLSATVFPARGFVSSSRTTPGPGLDAALNIRAGAPGGVVIEEVAGCSASGNGTFYMVAPTAAPFGPPTFATTELDVGDRKNGVQSVATLSHAALAATADCIEIAPQTGALGGNYAATWVNRPDVWVPPGWHFSLFIDNVPNTTVSLMLRWREISMPQANESGLP